MIYNENKINSFKLLNIDEIIFFSSLIFKQIVFYIYWKILKLIKKSKFKLKKRQEILHLLLFYHWFHSYSEYSTFTYFPLIIELMMMYPVLNSTH